MYTQTHGCAKVDPLSPKSLFVTKFVNTIARFLTNDKAIEY